jgi:hypothetical protein
MRRVGMSVIDVYLEWGLMMAFGDMLVQLRVPEKPAGSSMTDAAYIDAVTAAVDTHLINTGIKAALPSWDNRTDLPGDESGAPGFVSDRLQDAGVDVSLYGFTLFNKGSSGPQTLYCLSGEVLRCYGTVKVTPKLGSTPNAFTVDVAIDSGLSVTVIINFVVRPLLTFPT